MIFAKVQVSGIHALTESRKTIPAGLIGGRIEFDFVDSRWDNLTKTIVFQGCETRDVLLDGNTAIIPQEVVARPGSLLLVGVYGTDAENTIAIPTMWAVIGEVRPAADPSGDPAADPSLPIWAELESRIAEPDWNASHGQPGHIHNRTHKAVTDELDPVFNGNIYEFPNIGNEDFSLCQVSYDFHGIDDLIGSTLVIDAAGTEQTHIISQENITDRTSEGYPVIEIHLDGIELPVVVSVRRNVLFRDENDPLFGLNLSPGVHFLCIHDTLHAKSLSCLSHSKRTYYDTLHPNFLPDRRNYGELIVRAFDNKQTVVDEETGESKTTHETYFDHDFYDIDEAYKKGKFIRLLGLSGDLLPLVSAIPGELYTFMGFDGGVPISATFGLKAATV